MGELEEGATRPLAFFSRFAQMQACVASALRCDAEAEARAHEAAGAAALRALLSSSDVPRDRWPAVLFAAVPLLESSHGVLGAEDTRMLTARMQELQLHPWEPLLSAAHPEAEAQEAAVRLALSRNLARAWTRAEMMAH